MLHHRLLRPSWLLVAATSLGACAATPITSRAFLDASLGPKAAFDIQCPKEQLQYADLGGSSLGTLVFVNNETYKLDQAVSRQQGVIGCGRRGSYSYINGAWVGDSAAQSPAPAPAAPPQ